MDIITVVTDLVHEGWTFPADQMHWLTFVRERIAGGATLNEDLVA